ncbi:MAG: dihydropteroate synthase [Sarcina sp.]
MKIGNKIFEFGKRTYIMGILNITPDSFSDGGKYNGIEDAVERAKEMIKEGVDIIDIGGESTRPGHKIISEEEEINRVVPIILAIRKELPNAILSIDTYKGQVAEAAIQAGANMINDVYGLKKCPYIKKVAAIYKVPCCIMHNRANTEYKDDLMVEICNDMKESINIAKEAGITDLILDPGIGFAKTLDNNLEVMRRLEEFKIDDYPVLLGTSRKSMIGLTLDLPVTERVEGTIATTVLGISKGIDFIRVHDIKENVRAARMTDAIIRYK